MDITCRLHIHRTVHLHTSEFSLDGTFLQDSIIERMGKLLVDFFRTVEQGDTWLLHPTTMCYSDGITYHRLELYQCGTRDYRGVREYQQLGVSRDMCHRDVRQHFPLGQNTGFLIKDCTQQVIGID